MFTVLDNVDRDGDGELDCLLGHAVIDLEKLDTQAGLRSSIPLSDMVLNKINEVKRNCLLTNSMSMQDR